MPSHIVLPNEVETFKCNVPGCEEEFLHKSAYFRHVPRCARKHWERLIDLSEERASVIDSDPFQRVWDPEALEWIHKRNRNQR